MVAGAELGGGALAVRPIFQSVLLVARETYPKQLLAELFLDGGGGSEVA